MAGICIAVDVVTGGLFMDDTVTWPDCQTSLPITLNTLSLDVLFTADTAEFLAVFAFCFSLPLICFMVSWAYQSVISFFDK